MKLYGFDHVRLRPDRQIACHAQDTWELSWVVVGSGERTLGGVVEPFSAGDVVLVPPGMPHCWHFDEAAVDRNGMIENVSFFFRPEFIGRVGVLFPVLKDAAACFRPDVEAVVFKGGQAERIAALLHRMCGEAEWERAASALRLIGLAAVRDEVRSTVRFRKPDAVQQRLTMVRIYVCCNYTRAVSLDEVARHVGMNRSAFCAFFRKHTGQTFVEYLNAFRIEHAERLLRSEPLSVAEVGYACGFNSPAHFCRIFRRLRGTTPSQIALLPE